MEPRGTFLFDDHLDPDHATLGDAVAVDLRYLEAIVDGIREDGLASSVAGIPEVWLSARAK